MRKTTCSRFLKLLAIGAFLTIVAQASFIYSDFSSSAGLDLGGAATIVDNKLRLTPDLMYQVGTAWVSEPQDIADGFSTSFTFQLTASGPIADGIWFFIQNDGIAPGEGTEQLAIEFDTFQNAGDPNGNHVAFQSCGTSPNVFTHNGPCTLAINSDLPIILADGRVHTALITYLLGNLSLSLDGTTTLAASVDLNSLLNLSGVVRTGFATSTGLYSENNDILSWTFTSNAPEPSSLTTLTLGILAIAILIVNHRRKTISAMRS